MLSSNLLLSNYLDETFFFARLSALLSSLLSSLWCFPRSYHGSLCCLLNLEIRHRPETEFVVETNLRVPRDSTTLATRYPGRPKSEAFVRDTEPSGTSGPVLV